MMLTPSIVRRGTVSRRLFGILRCAPSRPLSRSPAVSAHLLPSGGSRKGNNDATSNNAGLLRRGTSLRSHNIIWNRNFSSEAPKKDDESGKPAVEASQPSVNKEGASDTPIGAAEGGNKTASPSAAAAAPDAPQAPEAKDKSESAETETRYCESDREDEEMQRSYDGFWPRFQVFKDMLFMEPSDREAALKRIIKTTSKVYGSSGVYAVPIKIHIDLQNPLLRKYGFRPEEFLEGAEVAFKTICSSVDPQATSDEEAAELYKAVLAPGVSKYFAELRDQVREQQQQQAKEEEEPSKGPQEKGGPAAKLKTPAHTTSQDIRLRAFFIEAVKTQIVPRKHNAEELPADTKTKPSFLASLFSKPSPAGAEASARGDGAGTGVLDAAAISSPHDVLKGYLPGCVVARVRVQFVYEKASWGPSELAVVAWDFTGCLSSQMDLEWKIVYTDPLFL